MSSHSVLVSFFLCHREGVRADDQGDLFRAEEMHQKQGDVSEKPV